MLGATLAVVAIVIGIVGGVMTLTSGDGDPAAQAPVVDDGTTPGATPGGSSADDGASPGPSESNESSAPSGSPSVTAPAPGSSVSTEPSASVSPPSAPPPSTPAEEPAGGTVPSGFRLHEDPTGFSIAVPEGWTTERVSTYVDFEDPGSGRYLRVDQTTQPKGDPVADWIAQEQIVSQRLPNYLLIGIEGLDYRGWAAADWEFTYGASGTHVLNRNVLTGPMAYALYWSVPSGEWDQSQQLFDVFADTFLPKAA